MPTKRPRRNSPAAAGLSAGERLKRAKLAGSHDYSAWGWVGTEVTDTSQITQEHRLATCGFSRNSPHPFCANKYSKKSEPQAVPAPEKPAATTAGGELEDDIIVISDDESPSCSTKACKNNPNCLNYLGQDKWEDEDKAYAAFMQVANLGENPLVYARDPSTPVGLKNLGATCYANAYLQVWFQDLPFRSGVFECRPSPNEDHKFEESPIFQLQVAFAAMQEGILSAFNPVKLVESLRLRTTEQQDAQEFSKLFMDHLDSEFQKQSVPALKSLVADQFQGTQTYATVCANCKNRSERESHFLEIEVNIEKNSKLEERINALLRPEDLSGDNKYFCSNCDSLQDAKRHTELKELPPVLHFSLLRFAYDLSSMERKKSKHSISFPLTINMEQFMTSPASSQGSEKSTADQQSKNMYHLRGILLHKGASAYHGHYEAQVFDERNQAWYQFNDETVTKIKSMGTQGKPIAGTVSTAESRKRKLTSTANGKQQTHPNKRPRLEDSDVEILDSSPGAGSSSPETETNYITSKDAYMLIYARASTLSRPPASDHVGTNLNGHQVNGSANKIALTPPSRAMRVVNDMNAEHEKACEEYAQREQRAKIRFEQTRQTIMDIYRSWHLSSHEQDSVVVGRQALESWITRHIAKLAKKSTSTEGNESQQAVDGESTTNLTTNAGKTFVSDILCLHDRLDPEQASHMKRITKAAYERIVSEDHCQLVPALRPSDICETCVKDMFIERLYQIEHPQLVSRFEEVGYAAEDQPGYWISKQWLHDWKLAKPKMHICSQPDPPPDAPAYEGHVKCEHDGLKPQTNSRRRISEEGYLMLKELFPSWEPFSTEVEPCPVCEALGHVSKEDRREARRQAEDEKARLKHMHDNALVGNTALLENVPCAIVPAQFVRSWKQWVLRPAEVSRPGEVDNTQFICQHGLLAFDPNSSDLDSSFAIVKKSDWDVLDNLYPSGPLIAIENNGALWTHSLSVCDECRTERKSAYEMTEVTIRVLRRSDPLPSPTTWTEAPANEPQRSQSTLLTYGSLKSGGLRHSKRIRQVKDQGKRRKVTIARTMTVKDIKVIIQDELNIPTIYQRLFHRGVELEDNTATAMSLGILSNDTLDLREESEDVDLLDATSDDGARRTGSEEGQGFGGTLLGGEWDAGRHRTSSPATAISKPCPACTFENAVDTLACTMCDTLFDTDT